MNPFLLLLSLVVLINEDDAKKLVTEGNKLLDQDKYIPAYNNYQKALEIFKSAGNSEWEAYALINIGIIHVISGEDVDAKEYLDAGMKLHMASDRKEYIGETYFHIGHRYLKRGSYKLSINHSEESLKYPISDLYRAYNFNNMGICFRELHRIDSAVHYHEKSLEILENSSDPLAPIDIAKNLSNLGSCEHIKGNYHKAIEYQKRAADIQQTTTDSLHLLKIYNRLAESYLQISNPTQAINYLEQAQRLYHGENSEIIRTRDLLMDAHNMIRTDILEREMDEVQEQNQVQDRNLIILGLLVSLIAALLAAFYYNQRLRNKAFEAKFALMRLSFVQKCLKILHPKLTDICDDVMTDNKDDATVKIDEAKKIVRDCQGDISHN